MADELADGNDVIIDGIGFTAAWDWAKQNGYLSAVTDVTEEGDVPYGATPAAENQPALAREKSDWYVWSVTNWQEGAGQRTHDAVTASDDRFLESENVDVTRQGTLRLTSDPLALPNPTGWLPTGKLVSAFGTVWCVFRQGANDNVAFWTGSAWQFPIHQPATGGKVSALCTDGATVYAAWPDAKVMQFRSHGGGVVGMTTAELTRVVAMCTSVGMLCLAREGVHGEDGIPEGASAGYLNYADPRAYVPCTPTLGESPEFITMPDMGIVALTAESTWVYLLAVNGQNTHLYRYQPLTGNFEDAAPIADGFVGTCLTTAVGNVFVGGYYHPGIDENGVEIPDVVGAIYVLIPGSGIELLTDVGADAHGDNRVHALAPHGKQLSVIAGEQLLAWDLVSAGWHHRCDLRGD